MPDEVYNKYKSMDPEQRERLYRAMQAMFVSLVEGKLDPATPVRIEVRLCEDRRSSARSAQVAYTHLVEALVDARRWAYIVAEFGDEAGAKVMLTNLRERLSSVALNLPDRESVKYLKRVHEAYLRIVEAYTEGKRVGEERIKELVDALLEMKAYLESRYPVF